MKARARPSEWATDLSTVVPAIFVYVKERALFHAFEMERTSPLVPN
jgi:hypothetical protein